MYFRNKIVRDTFLLTVMQLALDTGSLLLSSFITRRLGASATGLISLTGSFLGLAGILAGGNAFLCASRLVSEELGRKNGDPDKVLRHGICLCLCLSITVSAAVLMMSGTVSRTFFSGTDIGSAIKLMPAALVTGSAGACLKGYFNAVRRAAVTAVSDTTEFILRSGTILFLTLSGSGRDQASVCRSLMIASVVGNTASLLLLGGIYISCRKAHRKGRGTLSFGGYVRLALPVMGGGVLTAFLSSANDAIVPVCLRQYGDSVEEALGLFGIFEGIVLPTLFFPSVVLCSLSGIVVSETARAAAAGNTQRIKSIAERLLTITLSYAIVSSAVLMRSGQLIGRLLGGGETAGRMIAVIAPVVPFIYLEIILEAFIKGMGLQNFSTMNYLAEYVIRISAVLILVPGYGFAGIAVSYYASNIFGNIMRLRKVLSSAGVPLRPVRRAVVPAVWTFLLMGSWELLFRLIHIDINVLPGAAAFTFLWVGSCVLCFRCLSDTEVIARLSADALCKTDK